MSQLITPCYIARIIKFDKFCKTGYLAGLFLMYLLGLNKLNKIYEQIQHLKGVDFIEAVIEKLHIPLNMSILTKFLRCV